MQKSLFLLVLTTLWLSCSQAPTNKVPTPSAQHQLDSNLQVARQNY